MTCAEIQKAFTPYLDDQLAPSLRVACDEHLGWCLVCRSRLVEMRMITRGLATIQRPALPPDLLSSINSALVIERGARAAQPRASITLSIEHWLRPRAMPYTVSAFASILLFIIILSALGPRIKVLREIESVARAAASETPSALQIDPIPPVSPYMGESPSLNPNGALAALAWSPPQRGADDDDMIVVADVFGNGQASLAGVVQAPRNERMLYELEDALRQTPAFVPASVDHRPETVRVVFVLQKVNVRERIF